MVNTVRRRLRLLDNQIRITLQCLSFFCICLATLRSVFAGALTGAFIFYKIDKIDDTLKKVILIKLFKIYNYERRQQSDEQFLKRKKELDRRYKEVKQKYLATSDEKYKKELIKIKRKIRCNVSKSEYEICKKDLNALKEKYNFSNDEIWDFGYICGYIDILRIDRIK